MQTPENDAVKGWFGQTMLALFAICVVKMLKMTYFRPRLYISGGKINISVTVDVTVVISVSEILH